MRIRSIKPEFWRSDDIAALVRDHRLLFIGLWSYVDDNGVGLDRLASICADLFASDLEQDFEECYGMVRGGLLELSRRGLIVRYKVAGKRYFHIPTWKDHQRIDKPGKGRYPLPTCENATFVEPSGSTPGSVVEDSTPGAGEQGSRGEGLKAPSPAAEQPTLDVVTPAGATERDPVPSNLDQQFAEFWAAYPRKVGKDDGRKAWDRARKRASIEAILTGARRVATDPNLPEPKFIAHPATWLNRGGWDDEPFPGPARPPDPRRAMFDTWDRNAAAIDAAHPTSPQIGA